MKWVGYVHMVIGRGGGVPCSSSGVGGWLAFAPHQEGGGAEQATPWRFLTAPARFEGIVIHMVEDKFCRCWPGIPKNKFGRAEGVAASFMHPRDRRGESGR
jgi:hypothetical protein